MARQMALHQRNLQEQLQQCQEQWQHQQHGLTRAHADSAREMARVRNVRDVLRRLRSGKAEAFAVRVEHFEDDMRGALEWLCLPRAAIVNSNEVDYPRKNETLISAKGRANLQEYLRFEYQAHEELLRLAVNGDAAAHHAYVS